VNALDLVTDLAIEKLEKQNAGVPMKQDWR